MDKQIPDFTFLRIIRNYRVKIETRLDLYSIIPDDPKKCKIRDLLIHTLDYSLIK